MCIYEKNNSSNPHYSSWFHNYSCCTWPSQPQGCTNLPVQEAPTMTEPAECSCEGVLGRTRAWTRGRTNSQRPWGLGTVRRRDKWKATYLIGGANSLSGFSFETHPSCTMCTMALTWLGSDLICSKDCRTAVIQENTLWSSRWCFLLSASGTTQGFVKENPGSSAVVVTEGHLRKLQGKRRAIRDWWGREEGSVQVTHGMGALDLNYPCHRAIRNAIQ